MKCHKLYFLEKNAPSGTFLTEASSGTFENASNIFSEAVGKYKILPLCISFCTINKIGSINAYRPSLPISSSFISSVTSLKNEINSAGNDMFSENTRTTCKFIIRVKYCRIYLVSKYIYITFEEFLPEHGHLCPRTNQAVSRQ